ncbi:hypothetical protein L596_011556 [Steinernema carpocapsae]|uniref:RNase H type-1 domain-containing protein n=1 Tax=Steinernema carpocapsae TaxID=34508 RepID=A0A4U5NV77_STECR|nr:hypothetical protein L596_011556 [Steinernema carpocapsae]
MLARTSLRFLLSSRLLTRFASTSAEGFEPFEDDELLRSIKEASEKPAQVSDDFFWHNAPVVSAVASCNKRMGSKIGVYWGENSDKNLMESCPEDHNISSASLEALRKVLEQAVYQEHMNKLVVHVGSEYVEKVVNRYLRVWKENDFTKADGGAVKNQELIKDLDNLLGKIHVNVQHIPVLKAEAVKTALEVQFDDTFSGNDTTYIRKQAEEMFDPKPFAKYGPVVYAAATMSNETGNFTRCGYAIKWEDETIDGIPTIDETRRLSMIPSTLFRAELASIELALVKAVELGLPSIVLVTNSRSFVRFHMAGWKKSDGGNVANHHMYKQICAHLEKIRVKFVLMPETSEASTSKIEEVRLMAQDGLSYPTLGSEGKGRKRDRPYMKAYEREHTDNPESPTTLYLLTGKKKKVIYYASAIVTGPISDPEIKINGLKKFTGNTQITKVSLAHALIDHLNQHKEPCIVRTFSIKFIELSMEWLKIWEDNGYRTSKGEHVVNRDVYAELAAALDSNEVKFEFAQRDRQEEDRKVNEAFEEVLKSAQDAK